MSSSYKQTFVNGRYEKESELGLGGASAVFAVYDRFERRRCALKMLSRHLYDSNEGRVRLRREVESMQQIQHHNIACVYDWHLDPPAIALELIEGRNLSDWQRLYGPMPSAYVLQVAKEISSALLTMHNRGLIHRDIKPGNILIAPNQTCKLVDFGLARPSDSASVTQTGIMMGTFGFIAPEQIEDAKHVDQRADIYSLGATLLSIASGSPPLRIKSMLTKCEDLLSPSFLMLLMRMTIHDKNDRFQSFEPIVAKLQRIDEPDPPINAPSLHLPIGGDLD